MPNLSPGKAQAYFPLLESAMDEFEINNLARQSAFIAQLAHESAELRYFEEIASGEAYEGREDLGNTEKGDGKRFKGRGPIQITGRANYRKYGDLLGVNLVADPKLASKPELGFRLAGAFWKVNGLNTLADMENFKAITKRINGGYNGLPDRVKYYKRALKVLANGDEELAPEPLKPEPDKGVVTSTKPASETEGTPPPAPAAEVKASQPGLWSRIAAISVPTIPAGIMGIVKLFVTSIPPQAWYAFGAIVIVTVIVGAWLWNEAQNRAQTRTNTVMDAAADPNKNNLRLV
jgi:predicted chitinase